MFRVDRYTVRFFHNQEKQPTYEDRGMVGTSYTECNILKDDEIIAGGIAWCHPKDQFNKSVGRKVALAKALLQLHADRDLRKRFWDAYFHARNGKH